MSDFTEKDFKVTLVNMFTELKETMMKETREDIMTVLHQTNNINKEIEIILKEIKEPSGNSGVKKYNN